MKMKLKLADIYVAKGALKKLVAMDMETKGKYWIAKNAKKIFAEIEMIEEQKNEMIKKLGKKEGKGFHIEKGSKAMDKFLADMDVLLKQEVEVDIQPVAFEEVENLKVSPGVLMDLFFLFKDPVDMPTTASKVG